MRFQIRKLAHFGDYDLPRYETEGSAGMDLRAALGQPLELEPFGRALVPTGLQMAIAAGFEGQVRPRSGLASKLGLTVINAPGTIDSDYRGEVKVPLVNLSNEGVVIEPGMRIAQLVICPVVQIEWQQVENLTQTDREAGGFGSTGSH